MNVLLSGRFEWVRAGATTIAKWGAIAMVAHFCSAFIRYYIFVRPGALSHIADAAYVSGWVQGVLFCGYLFVVLWSGQLLRDKAIAPLRRRVI